MTDKLVKHYINLLAEGKKVKSILMTNPTGRGIEVDVLLNVPVQNIEFTCDIKYSDPKPEPWNLRMLVMLKQLRILTERLHSYSDLPQTFSNIKDKNTDRRLMREVLEELNTFGAELDGIEIKNKELKWK